MTTGLVWDERLMWHDTGTRFGPAGGGNVARRFATTRVGPDGDSIARLAAGIAAVDAVLAGRADNAFPPGSGTVDEIGEGDAVGTNINIPPFRPAAARWKSSGLARPLPPGSGEGAWLVAFERIVLPARAGSPWQALQPHQDRAIAAAEENGLAALMAR